ncbi:MAG: long-chain fatty acid--CoA ligase [Bacteroidales bacterium]|nr:long-chain fatty acid--CoA ligase [Bacteroidales bacterium]
MEITRTFDILELQVEKYNKDDALAAKSGDKWIKISSKEYFDQATLVSYALLHLGLKKGDRIAVITNNRPEWNFIDMGASQTGVVTVPVYPTISVKEYDYILKDAEPRLIFLADQGLVKKIKPLVKKVKSIEHLYTFDQIEGERNWKELLEIGRAHAAEFRDKQKEIKQSLVPEDWLTMIYTSGTTGFPKGVMLSHNNLISNVKSTVKVHPFGLEAKALSFLPISHIYERMLNYHYQYKGISIYYAQSMGTIINDIKEVQPDLFTTVPRLLERVYDGILAKGKNLKGAKKQIFFWAVNLALKYKLHHKNSWFYNLKHGIADKLVYSKWREALGGNTKVIVSGGAALQPRIATVFWAANIKVLEGYGLTETSPVIAVNNMITDQVMIGTVGPVIEGVEVKIADDGEILVKGPNVMMGYYKKPEITSEVIDEEGWFATGDIGVMVDKIYLKITDRKKEIFKLSSGKYIAPQVIENKFKESLFIEQIMVVGESEKFASALISPNFEFLHSWCHLHGITFHDNKELINIPEVIARYQREVNEINKNLAFHEQIKRFRLVCDEWSPASGELSPTLKLKRRNLYKKYEHLIRDIYQYGAEDDMKGFEHKR